MTRLPNNKRTKRAVKGWACFQPITGDLWSAWPDKDLALNDAFQFGAGEKVIPCTITYTLPTTRKRGV